jgi:diguanylate cyclase (GGDEF)-like protein/PAS domain S-box-containing protein
MDIQHYNGSIEKKLLKIILLVSTLTYFIGYSIFFAWYMQNQKAQTTTLATTVVNVLSQDFAKLIFLNEVSTATDITTKLDSFHTIHAVVLYTKNHTPIYQYTKKMANTQEKQPLHLKTITVSALYAGTKLGDADVTIEVETFTTLLLADLPLIILVYLFTLLISYFLAKYYALKFTKPILQIVNFLEKIDFKNFSYRSDVSTTENNEFGKLYHEINLMLKNIQEATQEQKIAAVAFETQNGIIITDASMKILQVNQAFTQITHYTLEEIQGQLPPVLQYNMDSKKYKEIMQSLEEKNLWNGEIYNKTKDGKIICENLTIQKVLGDDGTTTHYIFSFTDLTEQKETEKKLRYLMQYDPLTGLANKELFLQTLQKQLDKKTTQEWHLLVCFDIKDFKIINDVYGHETGDILLQEITLRLQENFPECDFMAKIGVDEFILSFREIAKTKEKGITVSRTIAEYINTLMLQPFTIQNTTINIMCHIGINLYDNTQRKATEILKHADTALSLAKQKHLPYLFFDKEIEKINTQQIDTYSELLKAIKEQQFVLYYQLQYNQNKTIIGAEALIRWEHPQKGLIFPDHFIPIAEKTGLIVQIGRWVIEQGCRQLAQWAKNPQTANWSLALNVSAKQFAQEDFIQHIKESAKSNNINYANLKIELVESMLVANMQETIFKMQQLKELGVRISMDDFGTGYSSLQYLKDLPLNQIKIDQSFVMGMQKSQKDRTIIQSMIQLAQGFELEVIAEGVETQEDFELLKELGCYRYQGYYFAKPQPLEKIMQDLANNHS